MFNAILSQCPVENWNWLRLNVCGFSEPFTEKHSPQTAHNLLQEEVARAEDQSEVISKSFASFIYTETLCVSFLLGPYPPCIKRQQNADKLLTCCFLAVLSGCCLFRHTVEWTWPANWTRTKQNESLTKVQKVFTLHDTSLIYNEPVDLNLRVTWGWKSTLKSTILCTTYKDGSVI